MKSVQRISRANLGSQLAAFALAAGGLSCSHAQPAPTTAVEAAKVEKAPEPDPRVLAAELSAETHAMLKLEGELLWQRWTIGSGATPASAASGHERLYEKRSLDALAQARAKSAPEEAHASALLLASLGPQAIARGAASSAAALDLARSQLAFAAPGDAKPERSERELDRLLTDEPSAQKRAAIADAEATAAAPLAELAIAHEKQEDEARASLGLPAWGEMIEAMHGRTPEQLAQLAEETLVATQDVAMRAVTSAAQRNLGQPIERLRRADLPRLVRATEADAELVGPQGWENARTTFAGLQLDPLALAPGTATLRVDSEPLPAKAARPLALLVDPPADVRLSVKSAGGFDEERALLHETARALGGALTRTARWESAQLGDGSAAEGVAWLAESLSGDPLWLREHTSLRGEPLDDLVHTEATRRLLAVRRAAALVLFEVQRRKGPQTAEAENALYRSLLTRATFAQHGEHEAGRWPLEVDGWVRACVSLRAALLGAELALAFEPGLSPSTSPAPAPDVAPATSSGTAIASAPESTIGTPTIDTPIVGTPTTSTAAPATAPQLAWWRSPTHAETLRKIWSQGRALTAEEAAAQYGAPLAPAALAALLQLRLAYQAPEKPPAVQRPDYKFMQGDHRPRHKAKKKAKTPPQ